jgi:hypothetical protein
MAKPGGMDEIAAHLYRTVRLEACTCERTFAYHGVGKTMCRRCVAMVPYEMLTQGSQ